MNVGRDLLPFLGDIFTSVIDYTDFCIKLHRHFMAAQILVTTGSGSEVHLLLLQSDAGFSGFFDQSKYYPFPVLASAERALSFH